MRMVLNSADGVDDTLTDRADADQRLVRQSVLARELGVTQKRVATWRTRSDVNGFPAPAGTYSGTQGPGRPGARLLWDLDEVRAWFSTYDVKEQRARGGRSQKGRKYAPDGSYTTPPPPGPKPPRKRKPKPSRRTPAIPDGFALEHPKKPITTEALNRVRTERKP